MYKKNGPKDVDLKEVGPRFEMRRMLICVSYGYNQASFGSYDRLYNIYVTNAESNLADPFPAVYEIKLGTVDQAEIDVEWRLRPYMNTARKRFNLSTD